MAQQPKQVRIDQLPPQQLAGLKQQLEEELQGLQQSAVTLQNVASEFHQSGEAIQHLAEQKVGAHHRLLVPALSAASPAA
jgi:prefoldin subunit 5